MTERLLESSRQVRAAARGLRTALVPGRAIGAALLATVGHPADDTPAELIELSGRLDAGR